MEWSRLDWVARAEGAGDPAPALLALEAALPGQALRFEAKGPLRAGELRLEPVHDRVSFVRSALAAGRSALLYGTAGEPPPDSVCFEPFPLRAADGTAGRPVWAHVEGAGPLLARLLGEVGEALPAWSGQHLPLAAAATLLELHYSGAHSPATAALLEERPELRAVPRLGPGAPASLRRPSTLGWLTYLSAEAAEALAGWLAVLRRFARVEPVGLGVLVQLTEDPLDLHRADHAAALAEAYRALAQA
jgi:Family of unknown function (DUF5953)